ncbi:MAG TPA: bifunctional 4-hydroxy-2-oxoglutarate aldolase/2-dehydro-3-deoxy-phosphogluconate aldolase, partial [Leptolyngbyaceae cyanobacterium]
MNREEWLSLLKQYCVLAVIRAPDLMTGLAMAKAAAAGGIRLIEITWNSDQPAELVSRLRESLPACWIGAGTLLTVAEVKDAIAAGAQYGFSPHTAPELIELGLTHTFPMVAGALTPTEIITAWNAGAAGVKVFPISVMGGAAYLHSLQGPLSGIPLIPTGGVTPDNTASLLKAGAIAVGIAGALFPEEAV